MLSPNSKYTAVLVQPMANIGDDRMDGDHLGLGYLASYAEDQSDSKYQVGIINTCYIEREKKQGRKTSPLEKAIQIILKSKTDIAGISATSYTIEETKKIAARVKELSKQESRNIKVIVGGYAPTVNKGNKKSLMDDANVDFIIQGEGEIPFYQLLLSLDPDSSQFGFFENIPGLLYKEDGQWQENARGRLIENLDELPFPKREFINKKPKDKKSDKYAKSIMGGLGCYATCSFCDINKMYPERLGDKYRSRSVENIYQELKELMEQNPDEKWFSFKDDNFLGCEESGDKLIELTDLITGKNTKSPLVNSKNKLIRFNVQTRANDVVAYEEAIEYAVDEGVLWGVNVGIETYSKSMLSRWGKQGATGLDMREQNIRAANVLSKVNIKAENKNLDIRMDLYCIAFDNNTSIDELIETTALSAKKELDRPLWTILNSSGFQNPIMYFDDRDSNIPPNLITYGELMYHFESKIRKMGDYIYIDPQVISSSNELFSRVVSNPKKYPVDINDFNNPINISLFSLIKDYINKSIDFSKQHLLGGNHKAERWSSFQDKKKLMTEFDNALDKLKKDRWIYFDKRLKEGDEIMAELNKRFKKTNKKQDTTTIR